jgi:large subunit ribosomal protein L4
MQATIYNQGGKEAGTVELPEDLFGVRFNADLVHQVVTSLNLSARAPYAHTKTRGEVAGGGRKPWRQKGTGRARHGSIRSPLWVGGGVTHGPRNEKDYTRKVNRKMKNKALVTVLSKKYKEGEIVFLDQLSFPASKTKDAQTLLNTFSKISGLKSFNYKSGKRVFFLLPGADQKTVKSFRNIGSVAVDVIRNLNPVSALAYRYLVVVDPSRTIPLLSERFSKEK